MADFGLESFADVVDVAHDFEIELNVLLTANHRLTLDGIDKLEEEETNAVREALENEDPEIIESHVIWRQEFYRKMRKAANQLAIVGLITRLQHWIERSTKLRGLAVPTNRKQVSTLYSLLELLNDALGHGPVPLDFFEELVTARDSVIHGDSKAEWLFKGRTRKVAERFQDCDELGVGEDQLVDAIAKAIEQVKWYDAKLKSEAKGHGTQVMP